MQTKKRGIGLKMFEKDQDKQMLCYVTKSQGFHVTAVSVAGVLGSAFPLTVM